MSGQVPLVLHSAAEHQMNRSLLVCSGGYWLFQKKCQEVWSHRNNILDIFISGHWIVPLSSTFRCGPISYTWCDNWKALINNQQTAEIPPKTFLITLPSKGWTQSHTYSKSQKWNQTVRHCYNAGNEGIKFTLCIHLHLFFALLIVIDLTILCLSLFVQNIHELRLPTLQFQDAKYRVPEPST